MFNSLRNQVIEIAREQITLIVQHKLSYLSKYFAIAGFVLGAFGASLIFFPQYAPYIIGGVAIVVTLILFGVAIKLRTWRE
jgi:hypothetical protein